MDQNGQTRKILVVEDEVDLLATVSVRLRAAGYEVITAVNGHEGLHKAQHEHPDLIILDIMLPGTDGYTICRMLKFDETTKNLPIVLFSARAADTDIIRGFECGADAYIQKPYEPGIFLQKIETLLSGQHTTNPTSA